MAKAATHFDAQTIALMKVALDEAWDRLPSKLQATMLKTTLAERILKSAADGERNRERLRDAATENACPSARQLPLWERARLCPRIRVQRERPLLPLIRRPMA